MLDKSQHLYVFMFLLAFAQLAAQDSIQAQTANAMVLSTDLRSAAKGDDSVLAYRAVAALEQLRADVIVYQSYDEFESDGRLARVPLETFTDKLNQLTAEIESILPQVSDAKLRNQISNSLDSYRDGAFWWVKIDQKRVVTGSNLRFGFTTTPAVERFFTSTVPYTVVVHWRQANKYLQRARKLAAEAKTVGSSNSRGLLSNRNSNRSLP